MRALDRRLDVWAGRNIFLEIGKNIRSRWPLSTNIFQSCSPLDKKPEICDQFCVFCLRMVFLRNIIESDNFNVLIKWF